MNDEKPPYEFVPLKLRSIDERRGPVIARGSRSGFRVAVRRGEGVTVNDGQAAQIVQSGLNALELAQKISPLFPKYVDISCADNEGYMDVVYQASQRMVDDIPQSQSAAVLHELMENFQENQHVWGVNNECLPQLAEFLFTGETRMYRFRNMTTAYYTADSIDHHERGWGGVVEILLPGQQSQNPDEVFQALLAKRELPEEEKIKIVQQAIENARSSTE